MEYQQLGNQYLIRLDRGEEVIDRLLFLLKKENITAAYLTGIGACDEDGALTNYDCVLAINPEYALAILAQEKIMIAR